ncbi:MAG: NAD(P)/FAD-dependent oxidoreductase [Bacteroidales bacterium]|nr:NAD(P)/FAD-dependent oxidoreductase [Bacteroidales bacterium]
MKVDIIGSGVAGLAAGIYLQKHGVQTTIYERSASVGGLMTGWRRGRYSFNGCLHWLLGSAKGISFNAFWREIIDIDALHFVYHDERVRFDACGKEFVFYNDIDRFERYLLENAPEDAKLIRRWMGWVRMVMPHLDYLPPVFNGNFRHDLALKMRMWRLLPVLVFVARSSRYTNRTFANKFCSPWLRDALMNLYQYEIGLSVLVFAQAYAAKRVAGYPMGGSQAVTQKLIESYNSSGGELRMNTAVKRIRIENRVAVGLELENGESTDADYVISAADWHWTAFSAIGQKYLPSSLTKLSKPAHDDVFYSYCMLVLGVRRPMTDVTHFFRINEHITSPDGTEYQQVEVDVYNYDNTLAPEGCCSMNVNFPTREGDFWINLRRDNYEKYIAVKQQFTNEIISRLCKYFGSDFAHDIEVSDLTTPATYYRYTMNYRGSSQGWSPRRNLLTPSPVSNKIKGVQNLLFAGHWIEAGGGVPVALATARNAAMQILGKI